VKVMAPPVRFASTVPLVSLNVLNRVVRVIMSKRTRGKIIVNV
jgi:hypothetical protein